MSRLDYTEGTYETDELTLHYYEVANENEPLVLIHAQGVDALHYENVFKALSEKYHIFSVDCPGHGSSSHEKEQYTIRAIGDAMINFVREIAGGRACVCGHSSGGLIAGYVAARSDVCTRLYLEDPPFFSSQGERRFHSFNYVDLSTVCHSFLQQQEEKDFVLYYFAHQKAWEFFPEKSREKTRGKMVELAAKDRVRHPQGNLNVPFWPKFALEGFKGMNRYDPWFGEAFYNDSFHAGIPHGELLQKIHCPTVILKAKTNMNEDGMLLAAMSDDDVAQVSSLIAGSTVERFDCGHSIHTEKEREFIRCLTK